MKKRIRIGILVDDVMINKWEYRILKKIIDSNSAELKLVIKDVGKHKDHKKERYPFIYKFHNSLDRFLFRSRFDFDSKIDISDIIRKVHCISVDLNSEDSKDYKIKNERLNDLGHNIDIMLNLGVLLPKSGFPDLPKYGIWSYRVGDTLQGRSLTIGYWETMNNLPVIEGAVYMYKGDDRETIIYRSYGPTYPESIHLVRNQIYASASVIIPRIINNLFENGKLYIESLISNFNGDDDLNPSSLLRTPSFSEALSNLCTVIIKKIGRKIIYLNPDLWFLIISLNQNDFPYSLKPDKFIELKPPAGVFWADPFIISKNNKHYIFIEEYVYQTDKGHITVLELDREGVLQSVIKIIEKPYHMSYPFIFELDNKYYMIPETMDNHTIELYRCKKFPDEWEHVMNLMENISAVDSTLFFHEKKWWLFTSIDDTETWTKPFNELFLFFTDDLFSGKWKIHPKSPIITDLRASRSAGKIVIHKNKIYRPSQDCSGRYGRAIKISQITKLNENIYEETLVTEIEPTWNHGLIGTHTINLDASVVVLDACQRARKIHFNRLINIKTN